MLLTSVHLPDGSVVDVRVHGDHVSDVAPSLAPDPGEDVLELAGHLLVPAFAEPHAHLDKAFLAEVVPNPRGDLLGAIEAMRASRHLTSHEDTVERAERAVRLMSANGATLIRSHADTTPDNGLRSVEALVEVRQRVADLVDLQIVALAGWPITGRDGAEARALLREAVAAGADLVGGCPHLEDDDVTATSVLLEIAAEAGCPVDLHTDETLDPHAQGLAELARQMVASGFPHPVTASHCVSLGMLEPRRQREVAEQVAAAGIGVVTLPQTNLYLQGRDHPTATPRGLTAVRALLEAGVEVAAGADNLQDPFNPLGRADPLETAGLLVAAAHLLPHAALEAVSGAAHRVLGELAPGLRPGDRADLVALRAATVRGAIASGPTPRVVIRRGRVVHWGLT